MNQQREGFNGYSGDQLRGYLDPILAADDQLLSFKSDYMNLCKGPRAEIREVIKQAKADGVNMTALRQLLADERAKLRRARKIDAMEADDFADLQLMEEALGVLAETPLGQAALKRAAGEQVLDSFA
jgi:hypothetical protein